MASSAQIYQLRQMTEEDNLARFHLMNLIRKLKNPDKYKYLLENYIKDRTESVSNLETILTELGGFDLAMNEYMKSIKEV